MAVVDPLSRLARQEHRLDSLDLPVLLEMFFRELPLSVKKATNLSQRRERYCTQYTTRPRLRRQKTVRWKIDCGRRRESTRLSFICLQPNRLIIIGC
jgi:hypothetical protein